MVKHYTLDREAAKRYLYPKRVKVVCKGLFFLLIIFAYTYFYEYENWIAHKTFLQGTFVVAALIYIGAEVLVYYLGIRRLTNSFFYLQGSTLFHEWIGGKKAVMDLITAGPVNADLEEYALLGANLYMNLPFGIKDREELLIEIHMAIEIYGHPSVGVKTGLDRLWQSKLIPRTGYFLLWTILTQIGGILYVLTLLFSKRWQLSKRKTQLLFISSYLLSTLLLVPLIAPLFGRSPLPITGTLKPMNYFTVLLNRHYVKTALKEQLIEASNSMNEQFSGTITKYLDANFPFISGFPLFPHLSHNDGKKVDLVFFYKDSYTGKPTHKAPSIIGYGVYESPTMDEVNYSTKCYDQGYYQYSFLGHLIPQWRAKDYTVDVARTKAFIEILITQQQTSKIFIEPHLKKRWGLSESNKIRFHGCQAVRHDDHIHLEID